MCIIDAYGCYLFDCGIIYNIGGRMTRRKTDEDIRCFVCGHPIKEEHEFHVHQRGTKDTYVIMHGECLNVYGKRKKDAKKSK